ncbi:hypothetical protein PRUPE_1G568700 [Prunus persica]|uniref:Uncharacterized protein n=1 Tax=Prunus persica TaxID=3760 RepID=A0A251RJ85_PRUPE|nr:hypothetical protein PRUPE_1G568700 [Prunus persica]
MVMLDWRTSSRNSAKQNYCAGNQVGEGGNVVLFLGIRWLLLFVWVIYAARWGKNGIFVESVFWLMMY